MFSEGRDFMVWLAVAVVAVGAMVFVFSNTLIDVTRYEISADRDLKILHLSDLHKKKFGRDYKRLFKKIENEKFDMVCFTGDLISRSENELQILRKVDFMKRLTTLAPVYYVGGNHESDVLQKSEKLYAELKKIGVYVINSKTVSFVKNSEETVISGLESESCFYKNPDGSYKNLRKITPDYIKQQLGEKSDKPTILLAHSPFGFESYCKWGAEIILSGHIHGGAVRLPLVKGLLSPERKFFPKYSGGVFRKDKSVMIVSRGLGKPRLFNNSEIVIVNITK